MLDLADVDTLGKLGLMHKLCLLANGSKCFLGVLGLRHVRVVAVLGDKDSIRDFCGCGPTNRLDRRVSGCLGRILPRPKLMKSRKCSCSLAEIKVKAKDIFLDLDFQALEVSEGRLLDTWDEASRKRRLANAQLAALLQQPFKNPEPTLSCPKPEFTIAWVSLDCGRMEEPEAEDGVGKLGCSGLGECFPVAVLGDLDVIEVDEYYWRRGGQGEISKVAGST